MTWPRSCRSRIQTQARISRVCALKYHPTHCTILQGVTECLGRLAFIMSWALWHFPYIISWNSLTTLRWLVFFISPLQMKVLGLREVSWVVRGHRTNKCHTGKYEVAMFGFRSPPPQIVSWGLCVWETVCIRFSASLKLSGSCNLGCDYSEIPLS